MKISELQFQAAGCCGEHRTAVVPIPDGSALTVYDDGAAGFRIVPTRGGVLCGQIETGLTAADVEARLP